MVLGFGKDSLEETREDIGHRRMPKDDPKRTMRRLDKSAWWVYIYLDHPEKLQDHVVASVSAILKNQKLMNHFLSFSGYRVVARKFLQIYLTLVFLWFTDSKLDLLKCLDSLYELDLNKH